MKVAALDLGSNTFLLLVAEVEGNRITKVYRDEIQVTKLGQGVHANRKFHPDALIRAEECLRDYSEIIKIEGPQKILAMATSAARDVSNGQELFKIGERYGIPIQIIPGHLEAKITFEGATFDLSDTSGVAVVDVGGGSTEVIAMSDIQTAHGPEGVSVDVGSVRLTEMFVTAHPIKKSEVEAVLDYADKKFAEAKTKFPKTKIKEVLAVAGTPTTLSAVLQGKPYSDEIVHGSTLTLQQLEKSLYQLAEMDLISRQEMIGMDPKRADVIVAGIAILISALKALKCDKMKVSTRGVRYGVALHAARN